MDKKSEIYVSTDVEADGPIPGINSMLSFGSAAYLADKTLISTFTANKVEFVREGITFLRKLSIEGFIRHFTICFMSTCH